MPLLLSLAPWWWGWHCCCCCCGPSLALLLTARAVLVAFCCTGCCCRGECMLVNKGGPFVVFTATDLPPPQAQDISKALPGWSQLHVAGGTRDCGVLEGSCQGAIAAKVHLLVLVGDLGHVPGVLEQDDIIGIEADGPVAGVLVRDVLSQINDGDVILMELVCEPVTHQTGVGRLHVVHDDPGMMIGFVGQAVGIGHLLQALAGQFVPTIRVPAIVGLTAKGRHAIATHLCPKQATGPPTTWRSLPGMGSWVQALATVHNWECPTACQWLQWQGLHASDAPTPTPRWSCSMHSHLAWMVLLSHMSLKRWQPCPWNRQAWNWKTLPMSQWYPSMDKWCRPRAHWGYYQRETSLAVSGSLTTGWLGRSLGVQDIVKLTPNMTGPNEHVLHHAPKVQAVGIIA